jgi:hypothetical protein
VRVVEVSRVTTGVMPEHVLDLAFADEKSLLVLTPQALALYRMDGSELRLVERKLLPGLGQPARVPGGLLLADGEGFCWALTSRTLRATLFAVARRGLEAQSEADAVPWPGLEGGVRFLGGTNLLQAALPGVPGPYLRLLSADGPWAVAARGELWTNGRASPLRVGPALAALWPGAVAAASAHPPHASDEVLVLAQTGDMPDVVSRHAVPGAVRALASQGEGPKRILAAAIEGPAGVFRIVLLELAEVGS